MRRGCSVSQSSPLLPCPAVVGRPAENERGRANMVVPVPMRCDSTLPKDTEAPSTLQHRITTPSSSKAGGRLGDRQGTQPEFGSKAVIHSGGGKEHYDFEFFSV